MKSRTTSTFENIVLFVLLVIATGARWREVNVPGEREYRNRGVAYCPHSLRV